MSIKSLIIEIENMPVKFVYAKGYFRILPIENLLLVLYQRIEQLKEYTNDKNKTETGIVCNRNNCDGSGRYRADDCK